MCKESPCYCAETGNGPCMHCRATTCHRTEWDEDSFLCDACYCGNCDHAKTVECDACEGHGFHSRGDVRGDEYEECECSQCNGAGECACPECCDDSTYGDAAKRRDWDAEDRATAQAEARAHY